MGVVGSLVGMASCDLGGVVLIGLSTLLRRISGVLRETGLPLRVRLPWRGVRGSGLGCPGTLS